MKPTKEFYSKDHDPLADHDEVPKCNHCGEDLEENKMNGDVCEPCYEEE